MSCSTVATPTSMMVASKAVLLADTADILSMCVGGDERSITKVKVHSQKSTTSPHDRIDSGYHANYNRSNGDAGMWGVHVKREQITQ